MALFGGLFKKLGDLGVGREITPDFYEDIEEIIRPVGFFHVKAKNIKAD